MTAFPGHSIALWDITGDARAHRGIAETALRFGELRAAEPALRRTLELDPGDATGRIALAQILAARGAKDEALAECARAAAQLPPGTPARAWCAALAQGG
jgi:predicted Zn-dependent protease